MQPNKIKAFTLIELIVVILIIGILVAVAAPRFVNLQDDARNAKIEGFAGALRDAINVAHMKWIIEGQPANNQDVMIDGLPTRFRNGHLRTIRNSSHVPAGVPNRNASATRLWYFLLDNAPVNIARNSPDEGWAMLANNCAGARTRCWQYRLNGAEFARIVYNFNNGLVTIQ